ncbi:MAG TPA: hypothetical protein PLS29_05075 [Acidimicrobiales bacterium]|nr:MAG: hypothetical protein B7Z69_00350 [Actinobacteria bacterium 21-73-9]HQU26386.1 hypothetical protein [Acidimicrobiales bacterium]
MASERCPDAHVATDVAEVRDGQRLSPVQLVRGREPADHPLAGADGRHRIRARHGIGEDPPIPCRLVDPP